MRFGPAFLVTAAFIGPGTITTASLAGANFGFSLLWVLVFSVVATFILQEMAARLGLITGKGLAESLRENIPTKWARWLAAVLVVSARRSWGGLCEVGDWPLPPWLPSCCSVAAMVCSNAH